MVERHFHGLLAGVIAALFTPQRSEAVASTIH